jgi:hypothetical protein
MSGWVDAELARKGRFYERNQYLLRSADRAVLDPAAPVEAQDEATEHRLSIAKDVPVLRIDHVSPESALPGVWRGQRVKAMSTCDETTRAVAPILRSL